MSNNLLYRLNSRVDDGEFFVSAHLEELIIIRGRNYFPPDLERTVESACDILNPASTVAFAIEDNDCEKLIVLAELKLHHVKKSDYLIEFAAIRVRLTEEYGIQAAGIFLLKPGAILKTNSGKLRRNVCKELFLQQGFEFIAVDTPQVSNAALLSKSPMNNNSASKRRLLRLALLSMNDVDAANLLVEYLALNVAALSELNVDIVRANHTLTSLGVDSLKMVKMKYIIDELLGIDISLTDLFGSSTLFDCTVKALDLFKNVSKVKHSISKTDAANTPSIMSYNQQALWMRTKVQTGALYHMPIALRIQGDFDYDALDVALARLYQRHSQLNSGFNLDEPWLEHAVCVDDAKRWLCLQAFVNKPFNLQREPPLRCGVFSCGNTDHVLIFCVHHLIVDFRSLQILLRDLQTYYLAQKNGQVANLASFSSNYHDFVVWQQNYLISPIAEQDREYWHRQLAGKIPRLELPSEKVKPESASFDCGIEILAIDLKILNELKYLAVIQQTTLYTLLLSIFKTLLYRYNNQSDLIVGTPILGRPKRDFSDLVGYFVNPIALRSHPHGEQRFCDYLAHVNTVVLEALAHQHYPYALLHEQVLQRAEGNAFPFRTWFVLQTGENPFVTALALGQSGVTGKWAGIAAESVGLLKESEEFDLTLQCAKTKQGLTAVFRYRCDVLLQETVQRMLNDFQCLLHAILANPTSRLNQLPLLTVSKR